MHSGRLMQKQYQTNKGQNLTYFTYRCFYLGKKCFKMSNKSNKSNKSEPWLQFNIKKSGKVTGDDTFSL